MQLLSFICSGNIIAVLTAEKYEPPFTSLETLLESNSYLGVANGTMWEDLFRVGNSFSLFLYIWHPIFFYPLKWFVITLLLFASLKLQTQKNLLKGFFFVLSILYIYLFIFAAQQISYLQKNLGVTSERASERNSYLSSHHQQTPGDVALNGSGTIFVL